jgi:hypothetical protein
MTSNFYKFTTFLLWPVAPFWSHGTVSRKSQIWYFYKFYNFYTLDKLTGFAGKSGGGVVITAFRCLPWGARAVVRTLGTVSGGGIS